MKFRTTLILLVVFAALGGYVYWTWEKEPATTTTTETIPIVEFDPQTVYAIEVLRDADDMIRLEKDPESRFWHLSIPITNTADLLQVTRVITDLSKLQATRAIPMAEAQTLDTYGLQPPQYEVHLFDADGETIATFRLGEQNPARTARYIQYAEEPYLYLVSSYLLEPVTRWIDVPPLQPTPTPTIAVVPTATSTPTFTATLTPTVTAMVTPTATVTRSLVVTGTATPVITATATVTAKVTGTTTPVITRTATVTATPVITRTATVTATSVMTGTAITTSVNPSRTPTITVPRPTVTATITATRTRVEHGEEREDESEEEERENEHRSSNR